MGKKYLSIRNALIIFFALIAIYSTWRLFKLDQDIQGLYAKSSSLDTAFASFLALDSITRVNPWQGLSDEYLRQAYWPYYFFMYGNAPSEDVLDEIVSRTSYEDHIKELQKIPETEIARTRILFEMDTKQSEQLKFFWLLLASQVLTAIFGIKPENGTARVVTYD